MANPVSKGITARVNVEVPQLNVKAGVTAKIGDDHFYDSLDAAREAFHASQSATGNESR